MLKKLTYALLLIIALFGALHATFYTLTNMTIIEFITYMTAM